MVQVCTNKNRLVGDYVICNSTDTTQQKPYNPALNQRMICKSTDTTQQKTYNPALNQRVICNSTDTKNLQPILESEGDM